MALDRFYPFTAGIPKKEAHFVNEVFMSRRRRYSPEFKREAIALTHQLGVSFRQTALEIGINPNLLSLWRREAYEEADKAFKGAGSPRDEEVTRLKRELARVKKERDFLREAAVFFPKESSIGIRRFSLVAIISEYV